MTMQNGLKAGLIGALIAAVLTLLAQIPVVGCCFSLLILAVWFGAGVLAGYFGNQTNPMQTTSDAAQAGALAGAITALGGGIVSTLINIVQVALNRSAQAFSQVPPETWRQLRQMGIEQRMFMGAGGIVAVAGVMSCCCVFGIVFAALLGAGGGALSPSLFKRNA